MTLILTMTLGLVGGYIAAVLCYFFITLTITSTSPHFVSARGRFRTAYLLLNCLAWTICAIVGGYLASTLSAAWFPWLPAAALALALAAMSWLHPIEAQKQLGGLSRVLMSSLSFVGVALGYLLKARS